MERGDELRAAVAYEIGRPLEVEDVETAPVGPRDVLVRVAASGICHTDLSVIEGLTASPIPTVPGHEGCGVVEEVGPEVRRVRVGDRVLTSVSPACGSCWWCVNGMSNHCEMGPIVRAAPRWKLREGRSAASVCGCGTFSEAMVVDESSVVRVETDLPDEQLALIGCGVTTGVGAALNTAGVVPGSSVAVIGCGGVGQSIIQGARIAGAVTIIGIDPSAERRQASVTVGATHVVDPREGDPVEIVRELTAGRGVDYSFEAVGHPELVVQAVNVARVEGMVTLVGMPPLDATVTLPAVPTIFSGKRIQGSAVGGSQVLRDIPRFIKLAESGRLDLGSLVSRRIKLDEINDGIDSLQHAVGVRTVVV
jgi:S-(hydroxymethyl)glutathione dehydrogenase / alcohol dehydrogenase